MPPPGCGTGRRAPSCAALEPLDAEADLRGDGARQHDVPTLDPVTPPLDTVLPIDPVRDVHVVAFTSGDLDPDAAVLDDSSRPLVFYAVDADVVIRLSVAPGRRIRIQF